jgi:hypothetical protein
MAGKQRAKQWAEHRRQRDEEVTIDYRKLLKDTIRGMIWAWDVPAAPGAVDADGEQTESSRAELEAFFDLVAAGPLAFLG